MKKLNRLKLISDEIKECFTCENLHLYIDSEQLWDFVADKTKIIQKAVQGKEEIERSIWEIQKELNFIQSQFELIDVDQ